MTTSKVTKVQTVQLGEDGLLPFLQNLYLGAGVEGAAKAAGCRVDTHGKAKDQRPPSEIDQDASYLISGAETRAMLAAMQQAVATTEVAINLLEEAIRGREAADGYIGDLLADPEFYEARRAEIFEEPE